MPGNPNRVAGLGARASGRGFTTSMNTPLAIVVPIHHDTHFVESGFQNIAGLAGELCALPVTLCSLNGGDPGEVSLESLERFRFVFASAGVKVNVIVQAKGQGFVASMNISLDMARNENAHVLVMRPDAVLEAGSLTEMLDVLEQDERFGFVAPSGLYPGQDYGVLDSILPRWRIVPSVPSGCLVVRNTAIEITGLLDEQLGTHFATGNYASSMAEADIHGRGRGGRLARDGADWHSCDDPGPAYEVSERMGSEGMGECKRGTGRPLAFQEVGTGRTLEVVMIDLMTRANGFGFLAMFANRAHVGYSSASPDSAELRLSSEEPESAVKQDTTLGAMRYPVSSADPQTLRHVAKAQMPATGDGCRHAAREQARPGVGSTVERLARIFVAERSRPSLLLDLGFLGHSHNGTSELARAVVVTMAGSKGWNDSFAITVRAHRSALRYHGLDVVLSRYPVQSPTQRVGREYSIWLLMRQPFSWPELLDAWPGAAMHVFYFLDNIAADCVYLEQSNPGLRELWDFTAQHASAIGFLSQSAMGNFYRRFTRVRPDHDFVAMPSCDPTEYRYSTATHPLHRKMEAGNAIFVVGNTLTHKRVNPVTDRLASSFPDRAITALGYQGNAPPGVVALEGGFLSDSRIAAIYRGAQVVVFPSMYEGFGFPILRSIGNAIPVVCRDSDVTREIVVRLKGTRWASLVYPVRSDDELVETVRSILDTKAAQGFGSKALVSDAGTAQDMVIAGEDSDAGMWSWVDTMISFRDTLLALANDQDELLRTRDSMKVIEHISAANESLRERVHEIEGSTSWRLTTPARAISERGRSLLQLLRRPTVSR
ncbi:MAG: glycosyltransferase [Acidimicrobiales bacterium]